MQIKIADQPCEFVAIHRQNYQTFVQEIPQYKINEHQKLIDRFHHENMYVIAF